MHSWLMTIETNLCELTATALTKALARREISAVDVTEAHLARIAARDAGLAAFITVDAEGARRQAAACDAARTPMGPLHGLPVAVKDLTSTVGLRTTYGSSLNGSYVPT
ncbi:MAG: amidase family protein, partial [Bradyrhizobium sp.]